jgi:DNA-binding CsgD family transcriptional regulator
MADGASRNGFHSVLDLGRHEASADHRRKGGGLATETGAGVDLSGFVDHFPDAILLVRQGGAISYANAKARQLILAGYPIQQAEDGRLALADRGARTDLTVSIVAATSQPPKSTLFICDSNCRPAYQVSVGPARGRFDHDCAVIMIRNLPEMAQMRSKAAEVLYALTPSEVRVLEALLKGLTPQEVAAITGTKITTVRTQIASVLGKACVKRQADLMTQVFNFPVI